MWKLVFNALTNRGTGFNREPGEGEFAVDLEPSKCGWFASYPSRYQYTNNELYEFLGWEAEEAEAEVIKARAKAEQDIRSACSAQLLALGRPYSPEERETWITQEAEARAWTADGSAVCPMVSAMATVRGIGMAEMCAKIIENADLFKHVSGQILGEQQRKLDELNS